VSAAQPSQKGAAAYIMSSTDGGADLECVDQRQEGWSMQFSPPKTAATAREQSKAQDAPHTVLRVQQFAEVCNCEDSSIMCAARRMESHGRPGAVVVRAAVAAISSALAVACKVPQTVHCLPLHVRSAPSSTLVRSMWGHLRPCACSWRMGRRQHRCVSADSKAAAARNFKNSGSGTWLMCIYCSLGRMRPPTH